jgi:predicted TPR repeat methyltransferase
MDPIKTIFAKASQAYQQNDLQAAKKYYEQILEVQPLHAQAMHALGMLAAKQQQWREAIDWMQKALTVKPNSPRFHLHLANALKNSGQFDNAHTHYKAALYWDPHYAEAHNNCGALLFKQKKHTEALQHYTRALHLKPDYLEAHFNLGLLFATQKQTENAIHSFNQVLALDPHSIQSHWQLANLYWQSNNFDKVQYHYQKLLKLTPHSLELLNNLGALALKQNQLEQAIAYFEQTLTIAPKHKTSRSNLAACLLQRNEFKASIWHYSLYLSLEPDDKEALYNRAQALMLTGQLDSATADLKKLLALDVNHIDARCNLAAIYLKLEDKAAAIHCYQQVLNHQNEHPIASYMLSALKQQSIPTVPPVDYVKNLFDNYALQFDTHLKEILAYKIPTVLRETMTPFLTKKKYKILDLGCGTGLSGEPFKEIAATLTGVDISNKMLLQAKTKNIYDRLIEKEITHALSELNETYEIILCIDTLVYFGDLNELFSKIALCLENNGLFGFSIELATKSANAYHLQTTGRYQHSPSYIGTLSKENNFTCLKYLSIDGRYQKNESVQTGLFVLKKLNST